MILGAVIPVIFLLVAKHFAQLVFHSFQLIVGNTHLIQQIVDRFNAELSGANHAKPAGLLDIARGR